MCLNACAFPIVIFSHNIVDILLWVGSHRGFSLDRVFHVKNLGVVCCFVHFLIFQLLEFISLCFGV